MEQVQPDACSLHQNFVWSGLFLNRGGGRGGWGGVNQVGSRIATPIFPPLKDISGPCLINQWMDKHRDHLPTLLCQTKIDPNEWWQIFGPTHQPTLCFFFLLFLGYGLTILRVVWVRFKLGLSIFQANLL